MPIDFSKPVQTRSGLPVRILCTDRKDKSPGKNVVGCVLQDGIEVVYYWLPDGAYLTSRGMFDFDLVNVPPPPARYTTAVYLHRSRTSGMLFASLHRLQKEDLDPSADLLGQVDLTLIEGVFTNVSAQQGVK